MGHIKDRIVVEADEDTSFPSPGFLSLRTPEGVIQQDGRWLSTVGRSKREKKKSMLILIDEGSGGGGLCIYDEYQERWMGRHGNRCQFNVFTALPDLLLHPGRRGICRSGFSFVFKYSRHTVYRPQGCLTNTIGHNETNSVIVRS